MTYIIDSFPKLHGYFAFNALVLLLLLTAGCRHKDPVMLNANDPKVLADTLPADFVAFFDKFHSDTIYQMDHILFPLEGLPSAENDSDTLTARRFFWQKADWKKHNRFTDPSHQFTEWFEVIDNRVIEHWIQMKGSSMFIRRRFAKLDNGWYLIYYAGLRPVDKK